MHRVLRLLLFAVLIIALVGVGGSAKGQSVNFLPAKTISTTPTEKGSTPIPLAEVVLRYSSVSENLREIEENLSVHRLSATVDQKVRTLSEDIDAGLNENLNTLTANPFLYELGRFETGWQQFGGRLTFWNRLLTARATELNNVVARLDQLGKTWEQTFTLAHNSGAPPAVLQRVQDLIAAIGQTHEEAEKQLAEVLTLQSGVAEQERRVDAARHALEQARKGIVDRLFVQDSQPIWSVNGGENLTGASLTSVMRQLKAVRAYAKRHTVAFVVHGVMIILLLGVLYWERPKVKRWSEEEPSFGRVAAIFDVPIATAVAFSFLPSHSIYPLAPQLLMAALVASSLIATTIVLRKLIDRRLFPILNVLLALYLLEQMRVSLPLFSRPLFLTEMLVAICFLIWLIRSIRLSTVPGIETDRLWKATKLYGRIALVVFSAAFAANALGFIGLANFLGVGVSAGAYVAFILYAVMRIAEALLSSLLKVRLLTRLGVVRRHRLLVVRRLEQGLRCVALLLWLGYTLELLALREPFLEKTGELLNADLSLGSLHFSLNHVLTFCITVWAAFLVSRFLRFVLEEDVYERLHLPRGLPYAISTVLHYTVLVVGFFAAAASLGLDMTKFTILAGAFTVGVGFGLQNIINNFVSGSYFAL